MSPDKELFRNIPAEKPGYQISGIFVLIIMTYVFTGCAEERDVMPKLNTLKTIDTDITSTTAILKGDILRVGNMHIIEYGIEISKSVYFATSQTKGYATSPSAGEFQVEFTGLEPGTLYYYKAYVLINTANVYSENYENFTTKEAR